MTDTIVALEGDALAAAHELHIISLEEKALKARKDVAKAVLATVLTEPGTKAVDPLTGEALVSVRAGASRFDAELAKKNLPPKALKTIMVEVPDAALAKEVLPPALLKLCQKQGEPSIVAL